MRALLTALLAASLMRAAGVSAQSAEAEPHSVDRPPTVVVADVHGAYDALTELLLAVGIVGADLSWTGADARLVSLGDLLDRGPDSRKVLDLLMRLEAEAAAAGGRVHVLLGNHEQMNLTGDLRYVSAAEFAAFAPDESDAMRAAGYAAWLSRVSGFSTEVDARAAFDAAHPPGYFAHRSAFGPDGRYGRWLLGLPALAVIGDTAFVHGGLPAGVTGTSAAELNAKISGELERRADAHQRLLASGRHTAAEPLFESDPLLDGPLWYRGSVYCKPLLEEPVLDAALEALGAARVVVGHTPTDDRRVRELYAGRLIMLDTGMLTAVYGGRPAALLIDGDGLRVRYVRPSQETVPDRGRLEAFGMTRGELLTALAEGEILDVRDGTGQRVAVRYADRSIDARFVTGASARHELAAFAVDRLLRFDLVPPTVSRMVHAQDGALQLVYPDAVSEPQRIEQSIGLAEWCPLEPQLQLLHTFDLIIGNRGREAGGVLFRPVYPEIKSVGHDDAFGRSRRLPGGLDEIGLLSPRVTEALEGLTEQSLRAAAGAFIAERDIRALLARRDALLDRFGAR